MKILVGAFVLSLSGLAYCHQKTALVFDQISVLHKRELFVARPNALAMSIYYPAILEIRSQLENHLKQKLNYLKSWEPQGEAHVTTITPPEFSILSKYISQQDINEIAKAMKIQDSDLEILELGRGELNIKGNIEKTFFVIVRSQNLIDIRKAIHAEFVRRGGDNNSFNPEKFYPHITVGYTQRDLHESDGVIKDIEHSIDPDFSIN